MRTDVFSSAAAAYLQRMSRLLKILSGGLATIVFLGWTAFADVPADKRVALVIGNGAYENAPRLDNATFDARAVADAFRKLGFTVVDGYNLDVANMRAKISEFSADLPGAKSAVMYYAGHGVSVDGDNYLIPTDIVLKSPTDLDLGAINVTLILKQMKREDRVDIVVLDACRDNPFAAALARNKTRAIVGERGLSRIDGDLARGTLIAFASDPGSTALDGPPGEHSPFTEAFLDHVFDSGVSIDTVMSRVRSEVWEKTNHGQLPWVNTSLIGDYALNPEPAAAPAQAAEPSTAVPGPVPDRQSREDLLWESAQHSNLRADYRAYLDAFPNGFFAPMARNRTAALENPGSSRSENALRPDKAPEPEPAAPKDWRAEIGTAVTEKALNLTPANEKEIQQRLTALGLYAGPTTGALDLPTRQAITDWQKGRGAALSSYLGPMQLAELREESEEAYQKLVAAGQVSKAKAAEGAQPAPRAARVRTPARQPAVEERTARERSVHHEVVREPPKPSRHHLVKRPTGSEAAEVAPAPSPRCNGNRQWCARAGLPVDDGAPPSGRPEAYMGGFMTGVGAGMLLGGVRRHY